jgi:starvation-inducible DNA-binding protein
LEASIAISTSNDLSSTAKTIAIGLLKATLANSIDLALFTKQAHWNIKGPDFITLHEMIDTIRTEIDRHVDTMAERIVHGTIQSVSKATTLVYYPTAIAKEGDHLAALVDHYGRVANSARQASSMARAIPSSRRQIPATQGASVSVIW